MQKKLRNKNGKVGEGVTSVWIKARGNLTALTFPWQCPLFLLVHIGLKTRTTSRSSAIPCWGSYPFPVYQIFHS